MPYYNTNLDNIQLYYEERGSGEPIVFVHGWSGSGKTLMPMAEILKDKYHCITYDHRGLGASTRANKGLTIAQLARDLKELIGFLGLKDVTLVGHSMGAATVYSYLGQFGCENLKRCVFIDMSPKTLNDDEWEFGYHEEELYDLPKLLADMELMNQNFGMFQLRFMSGLVPAIKSVPEALAPNMAAGLLGVNDLQILKSLWFSMFIADHRPSMEKLTVPSLYVYPEQGLYPMGAPDFIKSQAKAPMELVSIPNAGHLIPMVNPVVVAQAIREFLGKN